MVATLLSSPNIDPFATSIPPPDSLIVQQPALVSKKHHYTTSTCIDPFANPFASSVPPPNSFIGLQQPPSKKHRYTTSASTTTCTSTCIDEVQVHAPHLDAAAISDDVMISDMSTSSENVAIEALLDINFM